MTLVSMDCETSLELTDKQRSQIDDVVIVTGAPRSGTTLVGKLVNSLDRIEYQYEPPTLYMVLAQLAVGQLSPEAANQLLHVYLYEDLLLESVHGRRANLRPQDDSCVLNTLSWHELHSRWTQIQNRRDAARAIDEFGYRLAVKMPNILDGLPFLSQAFPLSKFVLTIRDGRDVARSILAKGWVSDETLAEELWPYRPTSQRVRVPYWVETGEQECWQRMSEVERACYMWQRHARLMIEFNDNNPDLADRCYLLRYEELLADPERVVEELSVFLGHGHTASTRAWLSQIRPPASSQNPNRFDFVDQLAGIYREQFYETNQRLGYEGA